MTDSEVRVPALRVEQSIGVFYVAVLEASLLLDVAYSDVLNASFSGTEGRYKLSGTQRVRSQPRLDPIADFINRNDSSFPNSIILAANHRFEDGLEEIEPGDREVFDDDELDETNQSSYSRRWRVEENEGAYTLVIPTREKLAAIIDGQHRLFAFSNDRLLPERRNMQLVCSVFLDLPKALQAQLFATINSTQKPVDRSLTFELFGYNIGEEPPEIWSPDKLAVLLTRRLATEEGSVFKGRITIAPLTDEKLTAIGADAKWKVSTAVVVDGILRLITSNPKRDANALRLGGVHKREVLRQFKADKSPLRPYYLAMNDAMVYSIVKNYVAACEELFWSKAQEGSFIVKTVGVQALFDVLRKNVTKALEKRNVKVEYFKELLSPAANIDFSEDVFRNASGSGRSVIFKSIQEKVSPAPFMPPDAA